MENEFIKLSLKRIQTSKEESDSAYFFSLLCVGEALTKMMVLGVLAAITDDKRRNRYSLEFKLVRKNGLGDWSKVLDDVLKGPASQYLIEDARQEQKEFTQRCKQDAWQYESVSKIKETLNVLNISTDELPSKLDLRQWVRLFSILRNKTRGHGATQSVDASKATASLFESIEIIYNNFYLFKRSWAYLYKNLSGKYRVSSIGSNSGKFDFLKKEKNHNYENGIYIYFGRPKKIPLMESDPELTDFFIVNGNFTDKNFELLSYITDSRKQKNSSLYLPPPGELPRSETEGYEGLEDKGNCFSNIPDPATDYIERPNLEKQLLDLLLHERHDVITLFGSGGIGKTSLTLAVIKKLCHQNRYEGIIWFSARDIDLFPKQVKQVQPKVLSLDDISKIYTKLVQSKEKLNDRNFNCKEFFEQSLTKAECFEKGCLFIFDNFETIKDPLEVFKWVDTFIRKPNKILITTRLSDFKGDYPLQVQGMTEEESKDLIDQTARMLGVKEILPEQYVKNIIRLSGGHPYIIKILLGEFSNDHNQKSPKHILAKKDEILTALFERTYATLSPCAQRAFMTLSKWNSNVPRLALEAVLIDSLKDDPGIVDEAISSLFQYSLAQKIKTQDQQEFISIPFAASIFGKNKWKISHLRSKIDKDLELLYMFGPSQSNDMSVRLANRLENFIKNMSEKIDKEGSFQDYKSILKIISQAYNPSRKILARFYMEHEEIDQHLQLAETELKLFLENSSHEQDIISAWRMLADVYLKLKEYHKNIHALTELAQISSVSFYEVSDVANCLNRYLSINKSDIRNDDKIELVHPLLDVLEKRKIEARADDFSRMAWLALNIQQETKAREYMKLGLNNDPQNCNCLKLKDHLSA